MLLWQGQYFRGACALYTALVFMYGTMDWQTLQV
jgi:hypothetical protein